MIPVSTRFALLDFDFQATQQGCGQVRVRGVDCVWGSLPQRNAKGLPGAAVALFITLPTAAQAVTPHPDLVSAAKQLMQALPLPDFEVGCVPNPVLDNFFRVLEVCARWPDVEVREACDNGLSEWACVNQSVKYNNPCLALHPAPGDGQSP